MNISPENEEILEDLESEADNAYFDDDYDNLLKLCRDALIIDSEREWAWKRLAEAHRNLEQYLQAIEAYLKLTQLDQQNADAYSAIADIYFDNLDQPDKAFDYYMAAHEIQPDEHRYCMDLARISSLNRNYEDAAAFYEKALELAEDENDRLEIMEVLAQVYSINEDHGNALRICLELMRLESKDPEIWNLTGDCYYALGDAESSIALYDQAIRKDPNNAKYHHNLFYAYMDLENTDEGIRAINEVIRLEPENSDALRDLGGLYLILEEYGNAKEVLEKSLGLNPEDGNTHYHLHSYFTETGNQPLAEMHLNLAEKFGHNS